MKTDQVKIQDSKIEGKGVFALKNFKRGETVLHWDISHTITDDALEKLPANEKRYISSLNSKNVLTQEPERYVNHSCEANTYAKDFSDIAKRDIKKDEEITADYSEEMPRGEKMVCRCGSKSCRKIIERR
jgi:SET domain-containing protein